MFKQALLGLIVTTLPAVAGENVISSHEVHFDQMSFTCGKMNDSGKVVRFIRTNPGAKYIPEYELAATDPRAKSWDITYRIICEEGYKQSGVIAQLRGQAPVR